MTGVLASALIWAQMAFTAGLPYHLERTMVAVVSVESSGCKTLIGDDGRSLGCGQVSIPAARKVGYEKVTRKTLIQNANVNMEVAAKYLNYCIGAMGSWERGLLCYNRGPAEAATLPWSKKGCPSKENPREACDVVHDGYLKKVRERLPLDTSQFESTPQIVPGGSPSGGAGPQSLEAVLPEWHNQICVASEAVFQASTTSHTDDLYTFLGPPSRRYTLPKTTL